MIDINELIERINAWIKYAEDFDGLETDAHRTLTDCKTALQESIQLEKDYCDLMSMYNEILNSDEKKCYNELEQLKYEYKKVMDRVEDTDGLVDALGKVEVCTGYDRCYPPNEYYEPLSEVMSKEEITKYIKAIQQYIRGDDE